MSIEPERVRSPKVGKLRPSQVVTQQAPVRSSTSPNCR